LHPSAVVVGREAGRPKCGCGPRAPRRREAWLRRGRRRLPVARAQGGPPEATTNPRAARGATRRAAATRRRRRAAEVATRVGTPRRWAPRPDRGVARPTWTRTPPRAPDRRARLGRPRTPCRTTLGAARLRRGGAGRARSAARTGRAGRSARARPDKRGRVRRGPRASGRDRWRRPAPG